MKRMVLIGFCISLSIELIQIPLDRWTDIDDLWINTLGAFFGYLLLRPIQKRFPTLVERCKVTARKDR